MGLGNRSGERETPGRIKGHSEVSSRGDWEVKDIGNRNRGISRIRSNLEEATRSSVLSILS